MAGFDSSSVYDSSTSLLAHMTEGSSCAPLLLSAGDNSSNSEDLIIFDCSLSAQPTPVIPPPSPPVTPATLPTSSLPKTPDLHLDFSQPQSLPTPTPTPPVSPRDVEAELRDTVDHLLRTKRNSQRTLAEENASLRAEISFLKQALARASAQAGSETADLVAALDRERTIRQNAEESRAATGKYLAEQVASVTKQKLALEQTLRDFTHGREFWKDKAIAALERCEALEEENLWVKTQLSALARNQSSVVAQQVDSVLREVAEERDRLRQLEDAELLLERRWKERCDAVQSSDVQALHKFQCRRCRLGYTELVDHPCANAANNEQPKKNDKEVQRDREKL
ncbi:hypothetical protein C8Q80DRAFT_1270510 [Daedaleopsis nitida]|nr:hypothetical protein C8Q80DRAFT_1270510 [Daedaleopsis nitida]